MLIPITLTNSQSNLIGIETSPHHNGHLALTLSIEPYWNWNAVSCFLPQWRAFSQSNLIGIETTIKMSRIYPSRPLNRTLLELKLRRNFHSSTTLSSQSYPIGIETSFLLCVELWLSLSIVPYWNWNEFADLLLYALRVSQSYLIGIGIHNW